MIKMFDEVLNEYVPATTRKIIEEIKKQKEQQFCMIDIYTNNVLVKTHYVWECEKEEEILEQLENCSLYIYSNCF